VQRRPYNGQGFASEDNREVQHKAAEQHFQHVAALAEYLYKVTSFIFLVDTVANCPPQTDSNMCVCRQAVLLDFKSEQIAEQMTLLDAELFLKIEIPEVLIWAQEQNEERSPNLTRFTEHFNKMSYW